MEVREPVDWSAFLGGTIWWGIAALLVAALVVVVVRLRADRSRGGRD